MDISQVTQSCYHYALKITWSFRLLHAKIFHLSLISWVNMFLREDLDHVSKDNILQIIFTYFAVFVLLQVLQYHPISKLGANRWKLFRGGLYIAFQTDISWNDFHLFLQFWSCYPEQELQHHLISESGENRWKLFRGCLFYWFALSTPLINCSDG